jgi:hypothetical protein
MTLPTPWWPVRTYKRDNNFGSGGCMRLCRLAAMVLGVCAAITPVMAADLEGYYATSSCTFAEQSDLPLLSKAEIEVEISNYYDEASAALKDPGVIGSRKPAFLWASETKFQCGKAIGYLAGGTIDEESVSKCDCFHGRFVKYR